VHIEISSLPLKDMKNWTHTYNKVLTLSSLFV
jgi:hypothetical protein